MASIFQSLRNIVSRRDMRFREARLFEKAGLLIVLLAFLSLSLSQTKAQETTPAGDEAAAVPAADETAKPSLSEKWDRLIYVPFRELQKVFDNQEASVVLPYAEYLDLMKRAINAVPVTTGNQDAVITSSSWTASVEKDLARVTVELKLNVLKEEGWATLPITFGAAAIGKVEPADGTVLLKGTGQGTYELLIKGAGQKTVTLELLATILTSPEDRSFAIQCPPTGISELVVTIPEPDQTVKITPLQVLLPTDGIAAEGKTVAKASLGATNQFAVHWNPRAGSKPVMDLLSSVTNQTSVRIEQGLLQSRTVLNYEILRGELRDVTILVPKDARIIDVVSAAGRIRSWTAEAVGETHQVVKAELLVPATEKFQIEIQTERAIEGDTLQLIGKSADGKLHGVHADAVVREAGRLAIVTDPSLTTVVKTQVGVKQVEAGAANGKSEQSAAATNTWEFSGTSGQLVVQLKPVEPRLLVTHHIQYVFRDDELRMKSVLKYEVERAGVFQLALKVPESLTIDSVSADGMSEFNIDKGSGKVTLSLTQKRMGAIEVIVQGHQAFDASAENAEMELPTVTPEGVERETGVVIAYAPEFLDVITVDEKLVGLFPSRDTAVEQLPRLRHIASWNFTRRPLALFVRTSPRPAQIAASVGTTVHVEPEIVKQNAVITFDIQNAGIDTLRVAVPEAVSNDVRFRMMTPGHTIQQRDKAAQAEDGWVTWTLVLQDETTGSIQLGVDWDVSLKKNAPVAAPAAGSPAAAAADTVSQGAPEQTLVVEPPRVLVPFTDDQAKRRRVVLTQTRGEIRLLRHESLSITADSQGDTTEAIDVRELELMEQDGYLAYRYFAQPASATIRIRKHEIHEVAATVVSRGAIEVVTERQSLASWRCRFRITTSERQRLRIDLPVGCDLQAPLLNDQRTTIEKATDVQADENWEAYYVNVSRESTSDQEFLLTLQFRCPIVDSDARPYSGRGGVQELHLPVVGESGGSTVVQQLKVVLWGPEEIAFLGDPDLWTQEGAVPPSVTRPLTSPSASVAAAAVNDWVDPQRVASGDFPTQGSASVYRAVGRQQIISVTWWSRTFLFWMISGTLVVIGLILRRTSWENRITLVLLAMFAVAAFSLSGRNATPQYVAMAWPGILVVGGIWLTGLLIGQRNGNGENHGNHESPPAPPAQPPGPSPSPSPSPAQMKANGSTLPPGTVSPAPEVRKMMDDLMGGGK
ncbi:MAG TPA: hypothetical protein PLY87_13715 [Planctomycetaceae bacterium]|nr:hypothetical protein [Planctomycetaceae bacterium]